MAEPGTASTLTAPRRLARNGMMAMGSRAAGVLLSLVMVPILIGYLGMDLYGLLTVSWAFVLQMAFLDLGFSAATTRLVSQSLVHDKRAEAAEWAWTGIAAQVVVGGAAAVVLWFLSPSLASLLRVDPELYGAAVFAFRLFALVIPLELVTRSFGAVLEGSQQFRYASLLMFGTAFGTNAAYVAGIVVGGNFELILSAVVLARLLLLGVGYLLARRTLPELGALPAGFAALFGARVRSMFGFGSWMTLNTAAGTFLVYVDRWVIGALVGVALVPLYTVPFSLAWHLNLISFSVVATLFPAFAALLAAGSWDRAQEYYLRSHRYLLTVTVPILIVLFVWAPTLLRVWIDTDFAAGAARPLRLLLAGMALALMAPVSGAVLQGAGRPDVLTRVYAVELPLHVAGAWFFIGRWGIDGAAAWFVVRVFSETVVLWVLVHRLFGWSGRAAVGSLAPSAVLCIVGMVCGLVTQWDPRVTDPLALAATAGALLAFGGYSLGHLLDARDRAFIRSTLLPRPG